MVNHGQVIPIWEPVKSDTNELEQSLGEFVQQGLKTILIENPAVGELTNGSATLRAILNSNADLVPGYIIGVDTTQARVNGFLRAHPSKEVALIHRSDHFDPRTIVAACNSHGQLVYHLFECVDPQYIRGLQGGIRAILQDTFQSAIKNAVYPPMSSFGNLPFSHAARGFDGFGDYLTVGNAYTSGGGPAFAVAIHVTRDDGANALECRHFVSDSNIDQTDPNGKQLEALQHLADMVARNPAFFLSTRGLAEFLSIHSTGNATNLGGLKRISMRHHLQLMMHLT